MIRKGSHVPDTPDQPDARPTMARPARNPAVVWVVATPLAWIALIVFCFAIPLYFAVSYGLGLSPIGGVDIPDERYVDLYPDRVRMEWISLSGAAFLTVLAASFTVLRFRVVNLWIAAALGITVTIYWWTRFLGCPVP